MTRRAFWCGRWSLAGVLIVFAQSIAAGDLSTILSFESQHEQGVPVGWNGGPPDTLGVDDSIRHEGQWSGRITRTDDSSKNFSSLTKVLPADIDGAQLTLTAWVRSRGVDGYFGLWMRQDARAGPVDFVNNYDLGLKGDREWLKISVSTELSDQARQISFGLVLGGTGIVWIDDVQLLVDGKPYAEAPKLSRAVPPWELDTEFDAGSGLGDLQLTAMQVENIATLIEVWGFLKYHHPVIAAGGVHIDYELFRILPKVLAIESADARNEVLRNWVSDLGSFEPCIECASASDDIHLGAPIKWIYDMDRLGAKLATALQSIYRNRPANGEHVFVTLAPGAGNAIFRGESPYAKLDAVDAGFRLLALARLWSIVQYWAPSRDLIVTPWPDVLRTAIPRLVAPLDRHEYALEMIRIIVEIRDTHANLWGSRNPQPPAGGCILDADFRFVEGKPVVWSQGSPEATGLQIGDVLVDLDGQAVEVLVTEWSPYYAASNVPTRLRDIGRSLSIGTCGESRMRVRRIVDGQERSLDVTAARTEIRDRFVLRRHTHDRSGNTYQELSDDVAYVKLSSIALTDIEDFLTQAQGKAGLVVDIRNYPNEFVTFELGQRLVSKTQPFARFTIPDLSNPGAFTWTASAKLIPILPTFEGRVAILVDETSQSQAEYTAMALRVSPKAVVVGSTTAGADGDVSRIMLPGGLQTMISGIGIFYPDKTPTQGIGIVPDIQAKPTVAGIRAGRDEVLEAALQYILGAKVSKEEISALAARP